MGRIFGRPAVPPVLATSTALSMTDSVNVLPAEPPASSVAPPPTRMIRPDDGAVAELRPVYFVAAPGAKVSGAPVPLVAVLPQTWLKNETEMRRDRKSTRLNSSHLGISYAVFCLKKKKKTIIKQNTSHKRRDHVTDTSWKTL